MIDWLQRALYEAPATIALGPIGAALAAGYAVMVFGVVYLTPAGERYLEGVKCVDGNDAEIAEIPQITAR